MNNNLNFRVKFNSKEGKRVNLRFYINEENFCETRIKLVVDTFDSNGNVVVIPIILDKQVKAKNIDCFTEQKDYFILKVKNLNTNEQYALSIDFNERTIEYKKL